MAGRAESELQLDGAEFDQIPVTQRSLAHWQMVERGHGAFLNGERESLSRLEANLQVPIPNASFLQTQVSIPRAPNPHRETAGHPLGPRLFTINDS